MATPKEIIVGIRFKCKQSGNVFEFHMDHDVNTMRKHPEYEEVLEQPVDDKEEEPTVKKVGRPKKLLDIPG